MPIWVACVARAHVAKRHQRRAPVRAPTSIVAAVP